MRIAILTSGRFWVCELARELAAHGHEVAFYSLVPKRQTRRFGLPDHCNHWLGPYVAPIYALARAAQGTSRAPYFEKLLINTLDNVASRLIERCDLFIGMSGMSLHSLTRVRRFYGARIFLERGSRHILSQQEILNGIQSNGDSPAIPKWTVDRELAEYKAADRIVVPSAHVVRSFIERGVDEAKLFRNPFGVDLAMFPPTESPDPDERPTILMIGTWSRRKGCDILVDAWRGLPAVRLLHVGPLGDAELPMDSGFEHIPAVPQSELTKFYARSHVFALASREEGLALVQAQALASGLPIVCTDRTGGEDLQHLLRNPESITVVPNGSAALLRNALACAIEKARHVTGMRDLLGPSREDLSWRAYGERYNASLN